MTSDDDRELLSKWAVRADESAFRALVERYARLVHGVAVRRAGGSQALAEETGQNVFAMLARKAAGLTGLAALGPWLHRATVLESAHLLRREATHVRKLAAFAQHAADMIQPPGSSSFDPPPGFDEALARLSESDRALLLRRFYSGQSYQEIAAASGKNEAAIRKRTERALSRLASQLNRRAAVTLTASTAAGTLRAAFSHAAPPGYAAAVGDGALAATPSLTLLQIFLHTLKLMTYGKTVTLTGAALLLLLAFGGSHLAARHYSAASGNSAAVSAIVTENARSPALSAHRAAPSAAPGDSPERARIRSLMRLISKSVRVDIAQRVLSFSMDPSLAGGTSALQAMADFNEEDLPEAWRLLPAFRGEPKDFEGLAAFLAAMKAVNEPPRAVIDALLADDLRINGKPPLYAVYETAGVWFEKDPAAAWDWLREAVAKGDFPFSTRKPFGGDYFGKWLEKDPAAALAALSPLPPEWTSFARQAVQTGLKHSETRETLWPELMKTADDRVALLAAECEPERGDWARKELLPWLLTRPWQSGVSPERIIHAWTWRDGELDEKRFGMVCESIGGLPTEEANRAVLQAVRGVFADIPAESRAALLEKLVPDAARREALAKTIQP